MAFRGKIISNLKTGQQIHFLQTSKDTGGRLLEMESVFRSHSREPVPHYHPFQEETFTVLEGAISVRLNGHVFVFTKGEQLCVMAGQVHSMWNDSEDRAVVNWKVSPALDTEYFLENGVGIANHKRTNGQGLPGLLQVALLAQTYSHVFRMAGTPYPLQKFLFSVLQPLSCAAGYKSVYREYLD